MNVKKKEESKQVIIEPINIKRIRVPIEGTSRLVLHRFSEKAKKELEDRGKKGSTDKKSRGPSKKIDPKAAFHEARHISTKGWDGIPCAAFRNAAIAACRLVSLKMTEARLAFFIVPDGIDKNEGTELVKIISKTGPKSFTVPGRNPNSGGAVMITRPSWDKWGAILEVEFDADTLSESSVVNLIHRAGRQVGIGEGRNFSKMSNGQGWGCFQVKGAK